MPSSAVVARSQGKKNRKGRDDDDDDLFPGAAAAKPAEEEDEAAASAPPPPGKKEKDNGDLDETAEKKKSSKKSFFDGPDGASSDEVDGEEESDAKAVGTSDPLIFLFAAVLENAYFPAVLAMTMRSTVMMTLNHSFVHRLFRNLEPSGSTMHDA